MPKLERIKSVFEGLILLGLVERRLPLPEVNVKVGGYEVDFYWPDDRLVLEADGEAFHSDPAQRAIDAAKQRDLERQGLTVLRATFKQFERDPHAVLDEVASRVQADGGVVGK